MKMTTAFSIAAISVATLGSQVSAGVNAGMKAVMMGSDGTEYGVIEIYPTAQGVLLDAQLKNLPAGSHGFHIHESGKCEAPFKTAGGHFNPSGADHGLAKAAINPNIHVPASGSLRTEVLNTKVTIKTGKDNDIAGRSIIIHAKGDNYVDASSAGPRIACGIISG